jgi:hypothetical protein
MSLNYTNVNTNGLTALVTLKERYSKSGRFQVYLLDTKTGAKSDTMVVTV